MRFFDKRSNCIAVTVIWVLAMANYAFTSIFYFNPTYFIKFIVICVGSILSAVIMAISLNKKQYSYKGILTADLICKIVMIADFLLGITLNILRYGDDGYLYAFRLDAILLFAFYLFLLINHFAIQFKNTTLAIVFLILSGILFVISKVGYVFDLIIFYNLFPYNLFLFSDFIFFILLFVATGLIMKHKEAWECPACHGKNGPEAMFCGMCGTAKPSKKNLAKLGVGQ